MFKPSPHVSPVMVTCPDDKSRRTPCLFQLYNRGVIVCTTISLHYYASAKETTFWGYRQHWNGEPNYTRGLRRLGPSRKSADRSSDGCFVPDILHCRLNTARSMVSLPTVKNNERVFLVSGTLISTSTSRQLIRELLNRGLPEQYVKDRAMTNWEGPAFITYNTKAARLSSLGGWPRICANLTPRALMEACFFYTGNTRLIYRVSELGITILGSYYWLPLFGSQDVGMK
jgi:hypothetical protein